MPTRTRLRDAPQPFGRLLRMPITLSEKACQQSVDHLNQLLADTTALHDLYRTYHWQATGPASHQLRLLFDTHAERQGELVDAIAERVQRLRGGSPAIASRVANATRIPHPPMDREAVPAQIARLLHAHEVVLQEARAMARLAAERDDERTHDFIVADVIRDNEEQAWFVAGCVAEAAGVPGDEPA